MKTFHSIFLSAAVLLLAGCDVKQTDGDAPVELSISSEVYTDQANSSALFSSVQCVPLETNQDVLIGDVVKIVRKDGFIYVADRLALYRFDEEGRASGKIQRNGQGPEEYKNISDFEVGGDQTVWILSRTDRTLYNYRWDGTLAKILKLDYWAAKIYFVGPEKVGVYIGNELDQDNRHQFKTLDLATGSLTGNYLEIDSAKAKFLHIHSANHFSRAFGNENGVYFFTMFEDVIHQWANDKLRPAFCVNINQRNIPPSFYRNDYADVSVFFQALFRENYAYGTGLFLDYGKDFLYAYFYGGECHFALISGESREATLDFKTIREDVALSGYPINLTKQSYFIQDNNELILPLIPADIIDYAAKAFDDADRLRVQQRIRYADEDQNPVLLILSR